MQSCMFRVSPFPDYRLPSHAHL